MAYSVKVTLNLPSAQKVIDKCGLAPDGAVQKFHTQNVLKRIQKYMPMVSGAFIKTTIANTTDTEIVSVGPHAAFLYYGKVMVDPETGVAGFYDTKTDSWYSRKGSTKVPTDRDLTYNCEKNPLAGPFWDRALIAAEGDILTKELQAYIDKKRGDA